MKKSIAILTVLSLLSLLALFVVAQGWLPPGFISATAYSPIIGCLENDGGLNIYQVGTNLVNFNPSLFNLSNSTFSSVSGLDVCLSNTTLAEGVCGTWINAVFNVSVYQNTFFIGQFNCSASNTANATYGCFNGACAPITTNQTGGGGNSTNSTGNNTLLADLIISPFNYTALVIGNATNSTGNTTTIFTYNVTLLSTVRNIGNAAAGASTTRFTVTGGAQQLAATPAIPAGGNVLVIRNYVLTSGAKTATSNADWLNVVPESNNNNNAASITFTLP